MVLDILGVVGIEQQSFVSVQKCYQGAFFSDLGPCLKQTFAACVDWICMPVWVERPFVFSNLANASDQQVSAVKTWNQEAFNYK